MLRITLSLLMVVGLGGCAEFFGRKTDDDGILSSRGISSFQLRDEANSADDEIDEWSFVATEARGNQMLEKDPDPWFKRWLMSPKANNIERNLGIAGPDDL